MRSSKTTPITPEPPTQVGEHNTIMNTRRDDTSFGRGSQTHTETGNAHSLIHHTDCVLDAGANRESGVEHEAEEHGSRCR